MGKPLPDCGAVAQTVLRAVQLLQDRTVERALWASREWSQRGYPTSTLGSGSSGSSSGSLVERIALSAPREAERIHPDLLDAIERLEQAAHDVVRISARVVAAPERKGRTSMATTCANHHCGELVLDGLRHGRCKPCARYLRMHDRDAPPRIIAARRRMREARAG